MKMIYRFTSEPIGFRSYGFFTEGAYGSNYLKKCPNCGRSLDESRLDRPVMQYQGGHCADFYSGIDYMLVSESKVGQIQVNFPEVDLVEVEVRSPRSIYKCENLFEIRTRHNYALDEMSSDIVVSQRCPLCKRAFFIVNGVASFETFADEDGEMAYRIKIPEKITGLSIYRSHIGDAHIFSYGGIYLLCDETFKDFCEAKEFSNIAFLPFGQELPK